MRRDEEINYRYTQPLTRTCINETADWIQMRQILKMIGNKDLPEVKPILELYPAHAIVTRFAAMPGRIGIEDTSRPVLEQALLVEGGKLKDPAGFVKRLNRALEKSL